MSAFQQTASYGSGERRRQDLEPLVCPRPKRGACYKWMLTKCGGLKLNALTLFCSGDFLAASGIPGTGGAASQASEYPQLLLFIYGTFLIHSETLTK